MRLKVMLGIVILFSFPFSLKIKAQTASTSWPMFQHDIQHTGRTLATGNPAGTIAWTFNTGAAIYASPVLGSNGEIYIGNYSARLFCLDRQGNEIWTYPTDGVIESSVAIGADGCLYFGDLNGVFYSLWPKGSERWRFQAGDGIYSSPTIAPDGTIYFTSHDT